MTVGHDLAVAVDPATIAATLLPVLLVLSEGMSTRIVGSVIDFFGYCGLCRSEQHLFTSRPL